MRRQLLLLLLTAASATGCELLLSSPTKVYVDDDDASGGGGAGPDGGGDPGTGGATTTGGGAGVPVGTGCGTDTGTSGDATTPGAGPVVETTSPAPSRSNTTAAASRPVPHPRSLLACAMVTRTAGVHPRGWASTGAVGTPVLRSSRPPGASAGRGPPGRRRRPGPLHRLLSRGSHGG